MFCPIMVDISDKKIGIIGGGKIAYRKAKNFLEYNASIIVVSPELRDEFNDLVKEYGDRV
ncbi:MAG: bifunctional precorrin-2 dehydrogenase/sirohydrochlorin ferrochelatase, partial [Clostridiales bacterium]|nr:bifunctional precorrin-2 dehydrogenase/sirohydrochlorin ferrochelatase [Clostridiales bacterium]